MVIYQIKNLLNNKIYIGSTVDVKRRWKCHVSALRNNKHDNNYLQNSWNNHGENNFSFTILEEVKESSKLIEREQYWLDKTECYKRSNGYNILRVAGNTLGYRHTEESKKIFREKAKGKNKGDKNNNAKLSYEDVNNIIRDYLTGMFFRKELALKYGVSIMTISGIINRKNWDYKKVITVKKSTLKQIGFELQKMGFVGTNNPKAKLNFVKAEEIRELFKSGDYSLKELANKYSVTKPTIWKIVKNKTWTK